jgi:CubicO group peptidase (beta-lactamase class C family)
LEQVHGKPFADAVRELVLEPCGMKSSTYRPLVAMTYPLALGHHPGPNGPAVVRPFADHAGTWAAGSLFTSAADYARFVQALLDGGRIEGKQALPAAIVARIQTAYVDIPALNRRYGYGLQVYEEDGAQVVRHTGGRMGYDSVMHLIPSKKVGVLVLGNRTGASFYSYARRVAQDAAGIRGTPGESLPESSTVDAAESARLAGKYVNGRITMELAVRDGAFQAELGGRWFAVRKIGPGRFRAPGAGPLTEFQILPGRDGFPEFLVAEAWALRRQP